MLPHAHITLSELQRLVKETLHERFALPVWVSAEISEVKVNYSGHCYLELVEKGGDNGVPLAQSRAVIWRTAYSRIAGYFEAETGQRLAAGIKILAKVAVNYHELYGFSLQITDIDPSYTLGDMERQRQMTIAQLQKEGVFVYSIEQVEGSTKLQNLSLDTDRRYAVVFGNEVKGVHQEVVDLADGCLEIPQFGTKHSLNVSVTAGMVIWELARQAIAPEAEAEVGEALT